jgi:hypothetical protein
MRYRPDAANQEPETVSSNTPPGLAHFSPGKSYSEFLMTLARQMATSPRTIFRKFKLPLDPELLTAPQTLAEIASIVRQAAATSGVAFAEVGGPARERDRMVIFYDTMDFDLYRNNFMLRKRVYWARDGAAREELVFKFRHADRHLVAAVDPRPAVEIPYIIRFKEQILPAPDGRGMRSIFWHGCKICQPAEVENVSFSTLARVFPALRNLGADPEERLTAVNGLTVGERLVELGTLEFAKSATAKALISLWRVPSNERVLTNEFSFQTKYEAAIANSAVVTSLSDKFYLELQQRLGGSATAGSTKAHELYGLGRTSELELSAEFNAFLGEQNQMLRRPSHEAARCMHPARFQSVENSGDSSLS